MTKSLTAALALALLAGPARADQLTLGSSAPVGNPIMFDAGTVSVPFIVFTTNNVNPDAPANFMTAWQFNLVIVPGTGATGTVTFNTPATGTPAPPPNYVFGANGVGISATNSGAMLSANDFHTAATGSQVPVAGANLLQMTALASANAQGPFGLFALQGANNTLWTDAAAVPTTRFFVNVPAGTGMVQIGSFTVVPEPALCLLAAAAAGLGAAAAARRRRRTG